MPDTATDDKHWFQVEDLTAYWREKRPDWNGVYESGDDRYEVDIVHPAACADWDRGRAKCGVGYEEESGGIDELYDLYETKLYPQEGSWEIEYWVHRSPSGPWGSGDFDAGVRFVDGSVYE